MNKNGMFSFILHSELSVAATD